VIERVRSFEIHFLQGSLEVRECAAKTRCRRQDLRSSRRAGKKRSVVADSRRGARTASGRSPSRPRVVAAKARKPQTKAKPTNAKAKAKATAKAKAKATAKAKAKATARYSKTTAPKIARPKRAARAMKKPKRAPIRRTTKTKKIKAEVPLERRGPKIIAVPRALEAPVPLIAAVRPGRPAFSLPQPIAAAPSPVKHSALGSSSPDDKIGLPSGVRLGRLPPRSSGAVEAAAGRERFEGLAAIEVTKTVPRRPLGHERWADVDRAAARLGVAADAPLRKVVRALVEGRATLSTALRGSDHVAAALIASILLPQTAVVVGPDAAQLEDLREKLERMGVAALRLDDTRADGPNSAQLSSIASGAVKLVLTPPKWLSTNGVLRALGTVGVSLVTVLEAQDTSTWSRTFSPSLGRLRTYLERMGRPPVLALAPGANSATRQDVTEALLEGSPLVLDGPLVRSNIVLGFRAGRGEVRQRALIDAVRTLPRPMLVFCATPRDVDTVHGALCSLGLPAHRYHEELRTGVRAGEQLQFSMPGDRPILVATSAFSVGSGRNDDAEGVPLRYGRRTAKGDIRSLVRFQPPTSVEQLVDELSLLGRDGERAHAIVFHDPSDRPLLEAELDLARPSGEQILLFGKALESTADQSAAVTTETLALGARTSLRVIQSLAALLDGMGLVSHRDGWLRRSSPDHVLLRELRGLAERYATVRALDVRRLGDVAELAAHRGCCTERLRRLLGDTEASPCGLCSTCTGAERGTTGSQMAPGQRYAPARRFTVATPDGRDEIAAGAFHSDARSRDWQPLTAKIADFG
jgi:ATP-dependent DNA helicase RecQ